MITDKQIGTIMALQKIQKEQDAMNQYYIIVELEEMTYNQAREAILILKYFTGTELNFDDLSDIYNEVGVIAG